METQTLAQQAMELINAETVIIALAEEEGKRVYYAEGVGKNANAIVGKRGESATSGLCGVVFSNHEPVLVCQTQGDRRVRQDHALAMQITTALAVPLYRNGLLSGAIMALNRRDGQAFDLADQQLLADYAAIASERLA